MKKPRAFLLAVFALSVLLMLEVQSVTASGDYWVKRAPMPNGDNDIGGPIAELNFGTVALNGEIYAVGNNFTEVFNPAPDSWASKTELPTNQENFALAACQGNIYGIGGALNEFTVFTGANEMYNPANDSWTAKASLPVPTQQMQADVVNGKIYVIGGLNGTTAGAPEVSDVTWIYDPVANSWSTGANIPTPVFSYCSAVVGNKIYVEGGQLAGSPYFSDQNQIYDPETNTWSTGQSIPIPAQWAAAAATSGALAPARLYVMGGTTDEQSGINSVQIYNPQTDNWTMGAQMPNLLADLEAAVVNDCIYTIGGYNTIEPGYLHPNTGYAENEEYIPLGYSGSAPPQYPTPNPTLLSSATPTLTPTVTEFPPIMIIAPLFIAVFSIAVMIRYRKTPSDVTTY